MKTNTIYKSEEGKKKIPELYNSRLERLSVPYKDLYVDTSFGRFCLTKINLTVDRTGQCVYPIKKGINET